MTELTNKQIEYLNELSDKCEDMDFGVKVNSIIETINTLIADDEATPTVGTPVNAVNATKVLTVSGVVLDGQTVTINNPAVTGTDVYEFLADTAQTKTTPTNIAVNVEASTTKASRVLTIDTQPTSGDTMTIGSKVFTFVPNGTANFEGEISVGTDLASAKLAIVAAINGSDNHNTPHPSVSAAAFSSNDCTITALVGGVLANAIGTTETFTAVTNVFAGSTLTGGADCVAANAITALVAAITASDTQGVGAADGTGDTVDFTADTAGVIGNAIIIGETMANGSFAGGATTLSGGVNGTVGTLNQRMMDTSYDYRCIAVNTIADKNWRRVSLGSAY
jgi:hypothetical protein